MLCLFSKQLSHLLDKPWAPGAARLSALYCLWKCCKN